ncbi:MAG: hypothetical protein A2X42_11175 [Candidatus Margulisbacteria bacterium GWF2_38_17]|nr:MAG: hypothetical protein A2X42_11175 [Candidatus Margulisbacteria bacterium GWF2_38_17]
MKIKLIYLLLFVIGLSITGCSNLAKKELTADNDSGEIITNPKPDNPSLAKYDQLLANVTDESSAVKAVDHFLSYVDTKNPKSLGKGISTMSVKKIFTTSVVDKIAKGEVAFRKKVKLGKLSPESIDNLVDPPLGPSDMAGEIEIMVNDRLGNDQSKVKISDVETMQKVTREALPHLCADQNSSAISPLEALTLAYYMSTNDDGSNPTPSIKTQSAEDEQKQANRVHFFYELADRLLEYGGNVQ